MSDSQYDLIVIGAGPGGYVAAIRAAQLGMRVACIEKSALGGTCLNVGCIPSKALLESSELFAKSQHAFARHGITVGKVKLDLTAMMRRKTEVVRTMNQGIDGLFRKNRIESVTGSARITKPGHVEVATEGGPRKLEGKRILIATGSVPVELPNMRFDGKSVLSSTEALSLPKIPKKLVIIGAGAIGLELGSVWKRLGAEVTVIEIVDRILPGMDATMTAQLQKILEQQGITFKLGTRAETVEVRMGQVHLGLVSDAGEENEVCDRLLVAVGRRPCTESLGLDELGVTRNERGFVVVDKAFQTNVGGIYAIGDVIPGPMLAHKAEEEGVAAVERMAGKPGHVSYATIPNIVYTSPELAEVGIGVEKAKAEGLDVRIGEFPFRYNGRAHSMDETSGMVRIVADAKTDRLLGIQILGVHASDVIAEGVIAMEFGGSAEDLARSMHAHPTLPEAIKEAAMAVDGRAIHM